MTIQNIMDKVQEGCKIYCYDCDTEERDDRAFDSMDEFFEAFPSAEITFVEAVGEEIRVYC